ncbi:MAG: hypothetical protein EB139_04700, partial [Burkholderiaceae bacterium]|nr:hypothetical protein [Burkholderiaceae bacterium]
MIQKIHFFRRQWLFIPIFSALIISGCGKGEVEKSKPTAWLPDTKAEQLPIMGYQGINFSGS